MRNMRFGVVAAVLASGWICGAGSAVAEPSNSHLAVSADGRVLAVANRDNGSISLVDLHARKVLREVAVGKHPEGVAFVEGDREVAVAVYGDDRIAFVDVAKGEVSGTTEVFDEPYGLVASVGKLYATLEYPGQVVEIVTATRKIARTINVGSMPRGMALAPGGDRLFVSEYLTTTIHAISLASGSVVESWPGASSENLARQLAIHPTRPKAYVPHIRSRVNVNRGEGSVTPYVTVVDLAPAAEDSSNPRRRKPLPMDSIVGAFVVANPWEVAVSPDGKTLVALFAGTDDLFVCDVIDDDYTEIKPRAIVRTGINPRSVVFHPEGREFYVLDALDFRVGVHDTETGKRLARIDVCESPLSEELLLGKRMFYTALEPMVGRRWISCSSCHPDGDPDGRTWQNPEGLRNTQSLGGMAWTHPIHWSADRDEVQDFEHTIRGELMQGRGLVRGRLHESLGKPNKGLSAALDALAAYTNSHELPMSPHGKGGLTESAKRGKAVYESAEIGCAKCHSGPFHTDSRPVAPFVKHDVGTGGDDPTEKMGPEFDTPSLLGAYRSAPYLHHGRAKTLREVLTTENKDDRHGKTSQLSATQIDDLVEFLKALPYEDPTPAAKSAGLVKVER
jgi:YVTN family beta-propeller protein